MPKSKRNKIIDLTKTKKHGLEGKKRLLQEIQACVDTYAHVFIFSVNDMRNSKMKSVRAEWRTSRFFIGKTKVMARALGQTVESEYMPNLHKIGERLYGQRFLLFTNQPIEEVLKWFHAYSDPDYARSGNIATEDVVLKEGPLPQFNHSIEAYLRQLGLPTTLKKGVIHLLRDHVVCKMGDTLSPETARILKLLDYEMAEFRINIECVWSQDGSFLDLKSGSKENVECPLTGDDNNESEEETESASFMSRNFTLAKDVAELGDEEMEVVEDVVESNVKEEIEEEAVESDVESLKEQADEVEAMEDDGSDLEPVKAKRAKVSAAQKPDEIPENDSEESEVTISSDISEMVKLTKNKLKEDKKPQKFSPKMTRGRASTVKSAKPSDENSVKISKDDADTAAAIENETQPDAAEMIKMTEEKVKAIERSVKKVQKFSPKMLRGRASTIQPATPAIEKGVKRLKEDNEDTAAAVEDETQPDPAEMIKMTEEKVKAIERSAKKVQKFSPKMLRGRVSTVKSATSAIENGIKSSKDDNEDTGAAIEDEAQPDPAEMIKMTKDKVKAIERSAKKVQKFSPKILRGRASTVKSATSADENSVKISKDDNAETAAEMMKMTEDKIKAIERTPPKYSPKLTRGKAAAMSKKKSAPTAAVQSAKKSAKKRKAV